MPITRLLSRLHLAPAVGLVLAFSSPARAGEEILFSREPDPITTICGGRCRPTIYVGRRYEAPRATASFESFSDGRVDAKGRPVARGPRPRAFDAVEGTPLDPLLNTTYDLNSPKNVPQLRGP